MQRYRKALGLIGTALAADAQDAARARIHVRIGEAKLRLGAPKEAIASLEKSLSLDPELPEKDRVLKALLSLYLGERDVRAIQNIEERLLARLEEGGDVVAALVVFGRMWMRDLGDMLRARERLESAHAREPARREVAEMLLELALKDGRDEDAFTLRKNLAETEPDAKRKGAELFALGRDLLVKKRDDEALDLLEGALEADPTSLEPLAILSRMLGERQEWAELEGAYRRMLSRAERVSEKELRDALVHELEKRLGVLLLEHLEDPNGALEALENAVRVRPSEAGTRRAVAELALKLGEADRAREQLMALVALDPTDTTALHFLFDIYKKRDQLERAFEVASVLMSLGAANERERIIYEAHKDEDVPRPTGRLEPEDWSILRAPLGGAADIDSETIELVAGVLAAANRALSRTLSELAARAGRLAPLDEAFRVDPETTTVSAPRSVAWACVTLAVPMPAVYIEEASQEQLTAVLRETPVTVIGSAALRGRSLAELSFLAGYHVAAHVVAHRVTRLSSSIDDLAACFLAAVVIAVPDTPVPTRIRALVEMLVGPIMANLDKDAEAALEEAVLAFEGAGGRADLVAYQRAVETAALRAGLLLVGRIEPALRMADALTTTVLSQAERRAALCRFFLSDDFTDLRHKLGAVEITE
ncbi:MAG: hypothetical protein U0271_07795 [Polyangiaceae bacterium]